MPNALAFIGGGLLEGVGRGLVQSGKEKRKLALADLEHKRTLERDEKQLEGRRGLLDDSNSAALERLELNIGSREGLATAATESRQTLASEATISREGIATAANRSREGIASRANTSREKAARIAAGKATDTTAAEDRIIKRNITIDENGIETVDHEAAATELEDRGFKQAAVAQRRKAKGIVDLDIRQRAEQFADQMVDEQSGTFSTDASDFKDDGGSRTRFRARMVREFIAKNGGTAAPVIRPATAEPPAATAPATKPAGAAATAPSGPFAGNSPPADHPDAKRANDGFWYVKRDGKFLRVQNSEENRVSQVGRRPR